MNKRLLKISLLTLVTIAITSLSLVSRADDTTAAPTDKPAKSKFSGAVTAVDASAKTFTVGAQTFTVTDGSQLSKNGQDATISDVMVGDQAKGSYTTGADGKLDATKVKFGKKSGGKHKGSDASTNAPAATPPNQ